MLYYSGSGIRDGVVGGIWGADEECLLENGEVRDDQGRTGMARAISDAVDAGADIISVSADGATGIEKDVAKAYAAGVIVLGAMPNDSGLSGYPAGLNGALAVQAFGEDGHIQNGPSGTPNVSDDVAIAAPGVDVLLQGTENSWEEQRLGSGTSFATPIVAGMLAVVKQKYPDATGAQLIQSLLHNTGTKGEHDPEWNNSSGYGAASLTGMLAVDPTKYPDANPLFDSEDSLAIPNQSQVNEAAAALDRAKPSPTSTSDAVVPPSSESPFMPWMIGGGIVLVLLVIGGIVLVIVLARRSRR
ncbi:S8 family peptidase [Microbacterium maritypicum]|uniref:S8 family serine peptidase n=1 Tax=Microbacterium maritypicum TaxID=33918 RepID=A0AAJ6ARQ1_MICMQ|nr:S8 family serine peptidase [Microbacterium liquefaciens]WEF21625.1 S8 family serine peptidase [Microbacterium liquefaciens]